MRLILRYIFLTWGMWVQQGWAHIRSSLNKLWGILCMNSPKVGSHVKCKAYQRRCLKRSIAFRVGPQCIWQIRFSSINYSCEGPSRSWPWARMIYQFYTLQRLCIFTLKSCYPIAKGLIRPHTPLLRKRGRVPLRGLYKVPLASENPLQFLGSAV
jgi:hypothetical protein